jgi:hypothetical protein
MTKPQISKMQGCSVAHHWHTSKVPIGFHHRRLWCRTGWSSYMGPNTVTDICCCCIGFSPLYPIMVVPNSPASPSIFRLCLYFYPSKLALCYTKIHNIAWVQNAQGRKTVLCTVTKNRRHLRPYKTAYLLMPRTSLEPFTIPFSGSGHFSTSGWVKTGKWSAKYKTCTL